MPARPVPHDARPDDAHRSCGPPNGDARRTFYVDYLSFVPSFHVRCLDVDLYHTKLSSAATTSPSTKVMITRPDQLARVNEAMTVRCLRAPG